MKPHNVKYLRKPAEINWRATGYQDPNEFERVLVIDPYDNSITMCIFVHNRFNDIAHEAEVSDVKWWLRLNDIPKPD